MAAASVAVTACRVQRVVSRSVVPWTREVIHIMWLVPSAAAVCGLRSAVARRVRTQQIVYFHPLRLHRHSPALRRPAGATYVG